MVAFAMPWDNSLDDSEWVLAGGEVVFTLHIGEVGGQLPQQLLLGLLLAHHGGHLLAQVAHYQAVDLCRPHPLHKLIHLRDKCKKIPIASKVHSTAKQVQYFLS